jgi:hypothetical protein
MGSDDHHLLSSAITSGLRRSWRSRRSAPNDLVSAASIVVAMRSSENCAEAAESAL